MSEEKKLPEGWVIAKVNEIADVISPGFPCGQYNTERRGFPHLRPMNIDGQGRLCLDEIKYVDIDDPPILHSGDILFNNTNSPVWVGKTTVISQDNQFSFSNHMTRLCLNTHAGLPAFFALQLQYMQKCGYFLARCTNHVNQASISSNYLSHQVDLLMPPISEQQRIVSAIEERFTILDAVTTTLQQNKQKLKLARASVLKHAVEGKLTEKWRTEHPATESGQQLLERILAERRAKWEAEQLAKGKDPKKLRYEEPKGPYVSELPELPEGWFWATVEQLASSQPRSIQSGPFGSALLHSEFQETGILAIGIDNVLEGVFSIGRQHRISHQKYEELNKFTARPLDVLITVMATVGRCCVVPTDLETAIITKHVYRISANQAVIAPRFLMFCFLGGEVRNQLFGRVQGQTRPGINGEILKKLAIPLPPLAEQQQIVAEVERRLSVIEQAEAAIETCLKRIERARQSILEQAFSGQLVPQDPDDGPASVLLERIQEERMRRVVGGKRRGNNGEVKVARSKKAKEQEFVPQWQLLRDAQSSELVDSSLSSASAHEDGVAEKGEVEQGEIGKEELRDLVQIPFLWD